MPIPGDRANTPSYYSAADGKYYEQEGIAGALSVVPSPVTLTTFAVTIANGASLSGAADLAGRVLMRIMMPDAWTAAGLTLQVSLDGVTYNNLYDMYGSEIAIAAAASRSIVIPPSLLPSVRYLKVRSGTSGTPVNQGGDRIVTLITRPVA